MITGFVLYLGESEWLIFQQSVEGREVGKGFYKWMETDPNGERLDSDVDYQKICSEFNGKVSGATSKDCPLPSSNYHPRGYLDSLLCRCL